MTPDQGFTQLKIKAIFSIIKNIFKTIVNEIKITKRRSFFEITIIKGQRIVVLQTISR